MSLSTTERTRLRRIGLIEAILVGVLPFWVVARAKSICCPRLVKPPALNFFLRLVAIPS